MYAYIPITRSHILHFTTSHTSCLKLCCNIADSHMSRIIHDRYAHIDQSMAATIYILLPLQAMSIATTAQCAICTGYPYGLTHSGLVIHICVGWLGHSLIQVMTCRLCGWCQRITSTYAYLLSTGFFIIKNLYCNKTRQRHVCKMAAILSQPPCVKHDVVKCNKVVL